jgi:hypothetical protein
VFVTDIPSGPWQYPNQYAYAATTPATLQNNYYAPPVSNYSYSPQYYQPWVQQQQSNWSEYSNPSYNSQPWSTQEQNNWPEYNNAWRPLQQPSYGQAHHSRNTGNRASGGYIVDSYSSAYEAQPSQYARDSNRPPFANRLPRNEHTNSHQYPRPARVSGPGPRRNNGRRNSAYTPLISYAIQRDQYNRDHPYPKPPAYSDPFALPQDTAPFVPRRVIGVELSKAAEFIPAYRQPPGQLSGHDTQGQSDADMYDDQVSQHQVQPDQLAADQGASSQSQPLPVDMKEEATDTVHDATNYIRHHDAAMPRISEDVMRYPSESGMQVIAKSEGKASAEPVTQAANPIQASVHTKAAPIEIAAEQAKDAQVQVTSVSTPTLTSSEDGNADRVTLNEVIDAPGDLLPRVSGTIEAPVHVDNVTAEVKDNTTSLNKSTTQEAVISEAVEGIGLPDGDKAQEIVPEALDYTTSQDVDMTQETITVTTDDTCPVTPSASGAGDNASSNVSTATDNRDRTPQNNRRKRRNKKWRQKASVTAVSHRFSVLTLSRDQGNKASPVSGSSTTSTSSPPNKRIKDDPASSPVAQTPARASPPAANGWGNFFAHIKRDDQTMAVVAKEEYKRLGGDTFRPEIKETYKDQKGVAEIKVHEKIDGRAKKEGLDGEDVGGVKFEREMSQDVVVKTE